MSFTTPVIACTYSEIALKGRNRRAFLRKLVNNMQAALRGMSGVTIHHVESRLLVRLGSETQADEAAARLHRVFGLQWVVTHVPDFGLSWVKEAYRIISASLLTISFIFL